MILKPSVDLKAGSPVMRLVIATIALAFAGLAQAPAAPDIVIVNARVFCGDVAAPWAEAVSITGARITRVGSTQEIRATATGKTHVIDANGRLLIPGINDAHAHPGASPDAVELEGPPAVEHDPTLDEVLTRVRTAVGKAAPGQWIYGEIGAHVLDDPRATRAALDPLAADDPVLLMAWTGHGTIVNTAALRLLGIREDEPDPPGGVYGRQPGTRTLNGVAREYAEYALRRRLSTLPDQAAQKQAFERYGGAAASFGITSVQMMATAVPAADAAELLTSADLPIRIRVIDFPLTAMSAWREPASRLVKARSPLVSVSGTKWILDGTPIERGMLLKAPYADVPAVRGRQNFSDSDLRGFLRRARAAREQPMIHAVGDAAIAAVLDALEATGGERWKPLRPRIEHGDMLQAEDFGRAARMGVTIVQNPAHFMIPGPFTARIGTERLSRTTQVKSIVGSGVPFALGSDGPMNPFLNIMFATINANNPAQALSIEQALTAYTAGSAAAEFAEREKGQLKAGMLADMALLSQDIFKVPPSDLPRTVSVLTIVNGRIVHSAQ
jgi:predicted amidohydrolase YtcJ